jgi:hypothetical protein
VAVVHNDLVVVDEIRVCHILSHVTARVEIWTVNHTAKEVEQGVDIYLG